MNSFLLFTAENNETDPFCKLVSGDDEDPNNQHYRFCVAVSKSSYFKDRLRYPWGTQSFHCEKRQVSFRTPEGKAEAGDSEYFERMTMCQPTPKKNEVITMYISRAYESNKVLVYLLDAPNGRIYLENLSTNVSVVE